MRWFFEFDTTTWPALGERLLDLGRDRGVHGGEHQLGRAGGGLRILHDQIGDTRGRRTVQMPFGRIAILLSRRAVARAEPRHVEPGMALQKLDEMLAHHSGGAQYTDFYSRFHKSCTMR